MEQIELELSPRTIIGKQVKGLRRQGIVPAVLYGRHMAEPVHLQMSAHVFSRVFAKASTTHLIMLNIQGQANPQVAMVRDVQREPISGNFYHVDFLAVSMTEKIHLKVPVVLDGQAPPVARNEGLALQSMDEIEIECLPGDLIDAVHVDVSNLTQIGMEIKVSDLTTVLTGIQIMAEPDGLIVRIAPIREEVVEEVVPAAVEAEVEVITKGKIEGEGEEEE
jgi:large subunit ribosomal protein L25